MAIQMIAIVLTIFFLAFTSGAPAKEKEIKVYSIIIRFLKNITDSFIHFGIHR